MEATCLIGRWFKVMDTFEGYEESHLFEVAEFARSQDIDKEPAFNWWVPYTLKKRAMIISKIKACIWKTTHKYGIEIPQY